MTVNNVLAGSMALLCGAVSVTSAYAIYDPSKLCLSPACAAFVTTFSAALALFLLYSLLAKDKQPSFRDKVNETINTDWKGISKQYSR